MDAELLPSARRASHALITMQTIGRIGRYDLLELLATGSMAELYRALLTGPSGFSKTVALKRLLPEYTADSDFRELFLHEGRIMAALNHRNLLPVLDLGEADGELYLCLELISGCDLAALLRAARDGRVFISPAMASWIAREVCEGLHYVHTLCDEQGRPLQVVHRDVTPHNILLSRHGDVKLGDFGIAKSQARQGLTQAGVIRGNTLYLSPEQASGGQATQGSDIYTVGLVLFEMLTLELYLSEPDTELVALITSAMNPRWRPPSELNAAVSPELDSIVQRALQVRPEERFDSARAMAVALTELLEAGDQPPEAAGLADLVDEAFGGDEGGPRLTVIDLGDIAARFRSAPQQGDTAHDGGKPGARHPEASEPGVGEDSTATTGLVHRSGPTDPLPSTRVDRFDPGVASSFRAAGHRGARSGHQVGLGRRRLTAVLVVAAGALLLVLLRMMTGTNAGRGEPPDDAAWKPRPPASAPGAGRAPSGPTPARLAGRIPAHERSRGSGARPRREPGRPLPRNPGGAAGRAGSVSPEEAAASAKERRHTEQPEAPAARDATKPTPDAAEEARARLQSISAQLAALGARPGDWPAGEPHLARARRHINQGNPRAAQTALKRAEAALAKLTINKAFVERKIRRLEEGLGPDAMRQRFPDEIRSILSSLLASRFDEANATLNKIVDQLGGSPQ